NIWTDTMPAEALPEAAIAIVGCAGRFPGADSVEALWDLLKAGRCTFSQLTDDELRDAGVPQSVYTKPEYVKVASVLSNIDGFDADFFDYNAQQATELDPQHRIFFECAWHALEDASCNPEVFPGAIGVFAGA